jgi:AcrR family transcriptional regulator
LVGAIEHLADERSKEFEAELNARLEKGDDPIDAMVDMLWAGFSGPLYWAVVELMVAARTDPELLDRFATFERSLGGRIYRGFKQLTGRGDRQAKIAIEMTLYFMRGLAMERIFREDDAHYDDLIERWKKGLRTMLS